MGQFWNEHVAPKLATKNPTEFGLGTVIPASGVVVQQGHSTALVAVLVVGAAAAGAYGYKFLGDVEREQRRLTPRRRFGAY
jgi:uncharacterized protein HemX